MLLEVQQFRSYPDICELNNSTSVSVAWLSQFGLRVFYIIENHQNNWKLDLKKKELQHVQDRLLRDKPKFSIFTKHFTILKLTEMFFSGRKF